jgi:hypothetical protein
MLRAPDVLFSFSHALIMQIDLSANGTEIDPMDDANGEKPGKLTGKIEFK